MSATLLREAAVTIRQLRRENEVLASAVRVAEAFALALQAEPPVRGMAVDIAWELERTAQSLDENA